MRESKIEKTLKTGVEAHGGECLKIVSPNRVGVFDRLVLMPGGHSVWIELKAYRGRVSAAQIAFQSRLRELGQHGKILIGMAAVDAFLATL